MPSDMREYVVTQSQTLIQATYAMTVWEQRLLLSCISQIDSRLPMPEDNAYTLTVEQARDLFYTDANARLSGHGAGGREALRAGCKNPASRQ